jgi:predicted outer membrane repeat protein
MYSCGNDGASSPMLTDVTFSGNWASTGGAMYNGDSSPTLTNLTFSGNSAYSGGAMYNGESSPTLTNATFSGNSAGWHGGAMSNGYSSPTLTNATFSGNSAGFSGGAMSNGDSSPTLTNVVFSGNSAGFSGGAMLNGSGSPTLTNVTFSGNRADMGGAMYNSGYEDGASSPTLTNVILWGNSANEDGDQMYNWYATPAIGYSLVEGGWDGSGIYNEDGTVTDNGGNMDADPLFVDAPGGSLRLKLTSPAIDAGDNSAVPSGVTTDLGGNPRFVDIPTVADTGSGTPPIVDMGAYEVQNPQSWACLPAVLRNQPWAMVCSSGLAATRPRLGPMGRGLAICLPRKPAGTANPAAQQHQRPPDRLRRASRGLPTVRTDGGGAAAGGEEYLRWRKCTMRRGPISPASRIRGSLVQGLTDQ